MSSTKLDIFELLGNIDSNNTDFLRSLPPETAKTFVPVVTARWLSGSGDDNHLLGINEVINPLVFSLYKHPELMYRLMIAVTPTTKKRYSWVKTVHAKSVDRKLGVIARYLDCSLVEARQFSAMYSNDNILEMADALGETPEFIKQLKPDLK